MSSTMRRWYVLAAMTPSLLVSGCIRQNDAGPAPYVVTDSAGMRIVTNHAPRWDSTTTWAVATSPRLTIGRLDGDAPYVLFRVSAAGRLSDGSIVLGNNGTREVRVYSADGRFLRAIGRAGDGPGEFRTVSQILVGPGDTIAVVDAVAFRISWFGPNGALAREATIDRAAIQSKLRPPIVLVGGGLRLLADGDLRVGIAEGYVSPEPTVAEFGALRRPRIAVVRASADLTRWDTVTMQQGRELVTFQVDHAPGMTVPVPPLYDRTIAWAEGDQSARICAGSQSATEVSCSAREGDPTVIRWVETPAPVTAAEVEAWRMDRMEFLTTRAAYSEGDAADLLDRVPVPVTRQPYGRIFLDRDGNLWVEQPPSVTADGDRLEMLVFDSEGVWLGRTTLPAMTPLEIGPDYIIGLQRDENDVEFVSVWDIAKPAGG